MEGGNANFVLITCISIKKMNASAIMDIKRINKLHYANLYRLVDILLLTLNQINKTLWKTVKKIGNRV